MRILHPSWTPSDTYQKCAKILSTCDQEICKGNGDPDLSCMIWREAAACPEPNRLEFRVTNW